MNTGFISTEDFSLALSLLTVPLSMNIQKDLPMMPLGDGLVPYSQLLETVLIPPENSRVSRALRQEGNPLVSISTSDGQPLLNIYLYLYKSGSPCLYICIYATSSI